MLTRGNAVCERAKCSDSGRASASMNAVSREPFTPAAVTDAITTTYLRATVADFRPFLWVGAEYQRRCKTIHKTLDMCTECPPPHKCHRDQTLDSIQITAQRRHLPEQQIQHVRPEITVIFSPKHNTNQS